MKKLFVIVVACMMMSFSGCATSGNGCCETAPSGIFGQSQLFRNRPICDAIKRCFQGDPCNTCNPPVGASANFGSNTAPLCESCGNPFPTAAPIGNGIISGTPIDNGIPVESGISLYDNNSTLSAPIETTTGYPNLVDPIITPGVELGAPTGAIETGYGEIPMVPNF